MLLSKLTGFLTPLLASFTHERPTLPADNRPDSSLTFELRQYHAESPTGQILFHDAYSSDSLLAGDPRIHKVRSRRVKSHRPTSSDAFFAARTRSIKFEESTLLQWDEEEIMGPDVEDRETLLELAKMTNNAYLEPGESGWYELGDTWNVVSGLST